MSERHPCGYCGEMTSNGCDVVAVVACDRHFGADTRAFAEMHAALAAESARAEAAEGREARLRKVVQTYVDRYGYSSDGNLRPSFRMLLVALAGAPEGEPAPACTEDRHIVLPSGEACVCGENRSELLL